VVACVCQNKRRAKHLALYCAVSTHTRMIMHFYATTNLELQQVPFVVSGLGPKVAMRYRLTETIYRLDARVETNEREKPSYVCRWKRGSMVKPHGP